MFNFVIAIIFIILGTSCGKGKITITRFGSAIGDQVKNGVNVSNSIPLLSDDTFIVESNGVTTTLNLTSNDNDLDGDSITISSLANPAQGTATIIDGNTINYTSPPNYIGTVNFTYYATDGTDISNGTVTLYVFNAFTWTGAGTDSSWSTNENWCGTITNGACNNNGTAPGITDIAYFTEGCSQCNADVTSSVSVSGIELTSSFSGTLTQFNSADITITDGLYKQSSGIFVGANANITMRRFQLYGGSYTAPSGVMELTGDLGGLSADKYYDSFLVNGQFNHNLGRIIFDWAVYTDGSQNNSGEVAEIVLGQDVILNNLEIDLEDTNNYGGRNNAILTQGSGNKVIIEGDLTIHDGQIQKGNFELEGDLILNCVSTLLCADEGDYTVSMTGANGNQSIIAQDGASTSRLVIDSSADVSVTSVNFKSQTFDLISGNFYAPSGNYDLTGVLERGTSNYDGHFSKTGGNFFHNNGTLVLSSFAQTDNTSKYNAGNLMIFSLSSALSLYNLNVAINDVNNYGGYDNANVVFDSTYDINIGNDLNFNDGVMKNGVINVAGDFNVNCTNAQVCSEGGDSTVNVTGSTNVQAGGVVPTP